MIFNKHSDLMGCHAFLGASQHSWLNYDQRKLVERYKADQAKKIGTELHEFAATCIRLGQKLPASKKTLNMYVNDAIGYKMTPEQVLYYSNFCFGTADSISFRDGMLRIHDLKTGDTPVHMDQLLIYDALFCLEYKIDPKDIIIENRIYQSNDILYATPTADDIYPIMDKIKHFDEVLYNLKKQEE